MPHQLAAAKKGQLESDELLQNIPLAFLCTSFASSVQPSLVLHNTGVKGLCRRLGL